MIQETGQIITIVYTIHSDGPLSNIIRRTTACTDQEAQLTEELTSVECYWTHFIINIISDLIETRYVKL